MTTKETSDRTYAGVGERGVGKHSDLELVNQQLRSGGAAQDDVEEAHSQRIVILVNG